jgi:hypothetical protein
VVDVNANPDLAAANNKYIMSITGDNDEGKAQLVNFIDPESTYPVIATTSQLMSTGVDAQTCKLIVLDKHINSMTEFKQIIGRGTASTGLQQALLHDHGFKYCAICRPALTRFRFMSPGKACPTDDTLQQCGWPGADAESDIEWSEPPGVGENQ